jgi:alkanesulfonate monooxygenase SsuD/methylene tetrahydromethanopterin reductase-like flavin-dependent oxidoreductase (luciferase family)
MSRVRYAINLPNFEVFADPRTVAGLARDAEAAGWDGVFVWDHLTFVKAWRLAIADPWIVLAAVALATERVRLGTMVTPLPRRRPWKLARETVTLDRLSGGRLVLGVGLGSPAEDEYGSFGEPVNAATRAAMLDEGLELLTRLWSGEPVTFHGGHYTVEDVTFLPTPLQSPRIPIWVAGTWPAAGPVRRAARFDGIAPLKPGPDGELQDLTADDVRALLATVREHRAGDGPFDVLVGGETPGDDPAAARERLEPLAEAGMTWWQEVLTPRRGDLDALRARVRLGPPAG